MEFDGVKNPHTHPLIFYHYQPGKPNVLCSKCNKPCQPPAFSCSECNFHIHQSCMDLPPNIRTPFHPHHPFSRTNSDNFCHCCGQKPYGDIYRCDECDFNIDLQCAMADTKSSGLQQTASGEFLHFAHPHPLILQQEQHERNRIVFCQVCERPIISGSTYYFCSTCDFHYHQDCAEMPREIVKRDYHDHPLFLLAQRFKPSIIPYAHCDVCPNECTNFFYSCTQCDWNLHVACVPLFKHQHEFYHFRKVLPAFLCQLCNMAGEYESIPLVCKTCHLFAHKKCADLPSILYISKHDHPLTLTLSFKEAVYHECDICLDQMSYSAAYFCSQCGYIVDLKCAKYLQIEGIDQSMRTHAVDSSADANNGFNQLKEDTQSLQQNEIILRHFSHKHNLSLCPGEDRTCAGCMRHLSTLSQSYGCSQCGFYLHQECATLPRRYKNGFFHSHELSMVYIPDFVFSCALCLQYCHGFAYCCKKCHYTIDIRCAAISLPFTHPSHEHRLIHYNANEEDHKCEACEEGSPGKDYFACTWCSFYLDRRCAHLPLQVRNRFDEHPLVLTEVDPQTGLDAFQFRHEMSLPFCEQWSSTGNEYYCDICEEERDENKWFYSCELCCFAAHINCVLGDYPFLKSAKFEGHQHPLSLVEEGKKGYSACGECGDSCEGNLAFECEDLSCKFNVHAFGLCYHNQLTQGRITFTMPSLRYRSIPHCPNIDQKDGSILFLSDDAKEEDDKVGSGRKKLAVSLRQYGGSRGKLWDDKVFSSIKRVVISHGLYIHSIQTEYYDDNESLTWSDRHGGNGGHSSEVELDYPDEYLISIHGYMGDFEDYYMIQSLVFESNQRIYGPFGREEGTRFLFPTTGGYHCWLSW